MKFVSYFFVGVAATFGLLVFGGYILSGPSAITSLLGSDMPAWGDGIIGSAIWLGDYYWSYIIGALIVLVGLMFAIQPRSKRRWPARPHHEQ